MKIFKIVALIILAIHPIYVTVKEYKRSSIFIKEHIRIYGWEGRTYGGRNSAFSNAMWIYLLCFTMDTLIFIGITETVEWLNK